LHDLKFALSPDLRDGKESWSLNDVDACIACLDDKDGMHRPILVWWLQNEFFPKEFTSQLRFPLVKEAVSERTDFKLLLGFIRLGQKMEPRPFNESLIKIAQALFDDEGNPRKCSMNIAPYGGDSFRFVLGYGGLQREFITSIKIEDPKIKNICLSSNITMRTGNNQKTEPLQINGIENKTWDLISWYLNKKEDDPGTSIDVKYGIESGMLITIEGIDSLPVPSEWPTLETVLKKP
jgi:hypothetical protein